MSSRARSLEPRIIRVFAGLSPSERSQGTSPAGCALPIKQVLPPDHLPHYEAHRDTCRVTACIDTTPSSIVQFSTGRLFLRDLNDHSTANFSRHNLVGECRQLFHRMDGHDLSQRAAIEVHVQRCPRPIA